MWVDKHQPTRLDKCDLHQSMAPRLKQLASSGEFPHLLFYGPHGSGKKTLVLSVLRELFGSNVDRTKLEYRSFKPTPSKTVEMTTIGSNYHIECNPSDVGNSDRFVIQEVIKEIASHGALTARVDQMGMQVEGKGNEKEGGDKKKFKVVILNEVDKLSKQAQAGLRRTMEKYSSACRLILICNSFSKVIEPVRSRCLGIRVPCPSHEELSKLLVGVAKKEGVQLPDALALRISVSSERNVRRALLMLQATKVQNGGNQLPEDLQVHLPDWQVYIQRMAREIMQEQSPQKLMEIREMFYDLLSNCIPADLILQYLCKEITKALPDNTLNCELYYWAAFFESRLSAGGKDIYHLEAFAAKFMHVYKSWLNSFFAF